MTSLLELERGIYRRLREEPTLLDDPGVQRDLKELEALKRENPLQFFEPHSREQRQFFAARTSIIAAFAGNRFGKTTALSVRALIECLPPEFLPDRLKAFKRFGSGGEPVSGWIMCPTGEKIYDTFKPTIEKWVPKAALRGGRWDKSWNGEREMLTFANGSTINFKTYKQDPSTLGGAAIHFCGYDEPPPKKHRGEGKMRLVDYAGYEMFAMTPLEVNTGWTRRDIWRKREAANITVIKASIHDNPYLTDEAKEEALSIYPEHERKAREFGDFLDFGGLIYPDFSRCVLPHDHGLVVCRGNEHMLDPEFVRSIDDHVVGIDPGIRNAGFSFSAYDNENVKWMWADGKLQDCTPREYAEFARATLSRWGVPEEKVSFVADPAARSRGQTNAETVLSSLALERIYANAGQNDVHAGIGQMRTRMQYGRYWVGPNCRYIQDEADDYAAKEPGEHDDDSHLVPQKGNDHVLDADRYSCMERFWDPVMEDQAPQRNLGWRPNQAPPSHALRGGNNAAAPLGSMS